MPFCKVWSYKNTVFPINRYWDMNFSSVFFYIIMYSNSSSNKSNLRCHIECHDVFYIKIVFKTSFYDLYKFVIWKLRKTNEALYLNTVVLYLRFLFSFYSFLLPPFFAACKFISGKLLWFCTQIIWLQHCF